MISLGDSYTSGDGSKSYPLVAGSLFKWQARHFAVGGSKMDAIAEQLAIAGWLLSNLTHIVFTTGGNDLGVKNALAQVITKNNYTAVEKKIMSLQPQLVLTYKSIQGAIRPGIKMYVLPYVDFSSVSNKISNEAQAHQMIQVFVNSIKAAAEETNIELIGDVKSAFIGHEMYSPDPHSTGLTGPGAVHPNAEGDYKIGEVVADYLKSH